MARIRTARDLMSRWKLVLSADDDLIPAIEALVKKRCTGAPVVDEAGELVGLLTEKDCLRLLSGSVASALAQSKVRDYMSIIRVTLDVDQDIFAMTHVFLETNFPVLPVLEHGVLVGRISRFNLLAQVERLLGKTELERARVLKPPPNSSSIEGMQRLAADATPQALGDMLRDRH